jgi:hypothetical protein
MVLFSTGDGRGSVSAPVRSRRREGALTRRGFLDFPRRFHLLRFAFQILGTRIQIEAPVLSRTRVSALRYRLTKRDTDVHALLTRI